MRRKRGKFQPFVQAFLIDFHRCHRWSPTTSAFTNVFVRAIIRGEQAHI
jgi:hypothetical protein